MYRLGVLMLGATLAAAQTAAPNPAPAPQPQAPAAVDPAVAKLDAALKAGTSVKILLDKGLNSKGASVGQEVTFKVVEGFVVGKLDVPKDSKVVAKVAQASARSKGDMDSILALEFTSVQPKAGQAVAITGFIQAIAGPEHAESNLPETASIASESRSGAATSTRFDPNEKIGKDPAAASGGPSLSPKHMGSGVPGVALAHGLVNGQLLSALRSSDKSVKLDSNSQVILRIAAP